MSKYDGFYCESLGGECINEGDCDNCVYGREEETELEEVELLIYELYVHCRNRDKCDKRNNRCKECFKLLGEDITPSDVVFQFSLGKRDLFNKIMERRSRDNE